MTNLAATLATSLQHLGWLNTVPHTIDHVVVVARENEQRQRRAAAQAAAATGSGQGASTSGHSDPTGNTAVAGIVESSAEATRTIDAALALVRQATAELHHAVADATGEQRWHPPAPQDRCGIVSTAIARLTLVAPDLALVAGTTQVDLDHLVTVQVGETTTWLRAKADAILDDAPARDREQPVQRARRLCTSCSRYGLDVDVDRYASRCRNCGDFQREHQVLPSERIVRMWSAGTRRLTPGMILEAKAQGRSKGRQKRGA